MSPLARVPRRTRKDARHVAVVSSVLVMTGCVVPPSISEGGVVGEAPDRITIVPDDYHVPYAGTAEDGRKFFLSEELFSSDTGYVGLFLWKSDGSFDEIRVTEVSAPEGLPPGQADPAGAEDVVSARLSELGDFALEPIEVEPFTQDVDGVTFGWKVDQYEGVYSVNIEPGNFIAYYEPWDGLEYDT